MQPGENDSRPSDEELVARFKDGNDARAAFEMLYRRHFPATLALLRSRTSRKDEADDLCQQAWLKAYRSISTHYEANSFRAWIFRIARNLLIDFHRRKRPDLVGDDFDPAAPGASVDHVLRDRIAFLKPCVEALDEDRREIVRARLANLSFEEISGRLGVPANTAMTRFHRAKDQLRDCIERRMQ